MASIKCFYCKNVHTTIAEVKTCSVAKVPAAFVAATPAPVAVEKVTIPAHRTTAAYKAVKAQITPAAAPAPVVIVHESLSKIQAAVKEQVLEIKKGQDLELGMYQLEGEIYKVTWNKYKTYKYAEKLVITEQYDEYDAETKTWTKKPKGKFYYAKGVINDLTSEYKMTAEMAKAFHDATKLKYGVDYGFCCVCAKLLTVKKSIDAGIGPVCAGKL
jgi:hypothetical protein